MLARSVQALRDIAQGPAHRWWALAAVECGNFVGYTDGFIVALALPTLVRQLGVDLSVLKNAWSGAGGSSGAHQR
jgi:hypothetical protein